MTEQMQGALTLALSCFFAGVALGFWVGRSSTDHRLREENLSLREQVVVLKSAAGEPDSRSTWVIFLLVFIAGLMVIWFR